VRRETVILILACSYACLVAVAPWLPVVLGVIAGVLAAALGLFVSVVGLEEWKRSEPVMRPPEAEFLHAEMSVIWSVSVGKMVPRDTGLIALLPMVASLLILATEAGDPWSVPLAVAAAVPTLSYAAILFRQMFGARGHRFHLDAAGASYTRRTGVRSVTLRLERPVELLDSDHGITLVDHALVVPVPRSAVRDRLVGTLRRPPGGERVEPPTELKSLAGRARSPQTEGTQR